MVAVSDLPQIRKLPEKSNAPGGKNQGLLRTFAGPPGKNPYACHFKGKHGKLYIVGKLNKCRFREKIQIASFLNSTKEYCKNDRHNDHALFN